ncbi:B2 bradykinin receptor [Microcaecilia unicolor]|uniref:B2 bradykinin receptor n=1 Tax=Microcaecilia unicolor TaxID=1415580 RepID=A0A6P7Z6Q8_9AMPH|nr:B2 bradykinin receptor [Microcaecilia unicolor]
MANITAEESTATYKILMSWNKSLDSHEAAENSSNSSQCSVLVGLDWLFIGQPVFLWIIFVLGVIENVFVLSVFCLHKSRCTVAEIYFGNMAAADLLLVSGLPFWAIFISKEFYWPFGQFMCKAVNALIYMNLYSSIYFLMMVSIDRYLALVKTMSIGRSRRPFCAKLNCFIIWVFALLNSMPTWLYRRVDFSKKLNKTSCLLFYPSEEWTVANHWLLNIVGFLIPLYIIMFCTVQIIKALRDSSMQKLKEIQTEKKAATLVIIVLLVFIICWLPFQLVTFLDTLYIYKVIAGCTVERVLTIATQISSYCAYSNSCLNPMLYVIVGNHFRKKSKELYKELLAGRYWRRNTNASLAKDSSVDTVRTSISMGCPINKLVS